MGNTPPAPVEEAPVVPPPFSDDGYDWPKNLYVEARDMLAVAIFVYTFGYISDVGRKEGINGLQVDPDGKSKKEGCTFELQRSFTPSEVKKLVKDNEEKLAGYYPTTFSDAELEKMYAKLDMLDARAKSVSEGNERPLTLEEFDDRHQDQGMVYAVCKDSVNKRITLVFRGTENSLAFKTNWMTNLFLVKKSADVPDSLKGKIKSEKIWFHSGFYDYVFNKTAKESDAEEKRKYDEILEDVLALLTKNPGYKLFVTGHSLGAALSSLVSFFFSCEADIPKPVTCLGFASPRVGGSEFLEAIQAQEKERQIRFLRIMNDNDSIAVMPVVGYNHVGFQARLYESVDYTPEITYPKTDEDWYDWFGRAWGNSVPASFNLGYDHGYGGYEERVEKDQNELEKINLNQLYANKALTGFD